MSNLERRDVDEAPTRDKVRIIGVELTYINPQGERSELEMFSCRHTYLRDYYRNARGMVQQGAGNFGPALQVTLHTTEGDVAATIGLP
jgi:hypothetical protein